MYYSMLHLVVCQLGVLLKKHKFETAHEVRIKARVTYNSSERQHKSSYESIAALNDRINARMTWSAVYFYRSGLLQVSKAFMLFF